MRSLESWISTRPLHEGEVVSHFKSLGRFGRNFVKELPSVFLEVLHTSLALRFLNSMYKSTVKS